MWYENCLLFVLFLNSLYGRMSDVAFLIMLIDLYKHIICLMVEKSTSLSLTRFPETYELESYSFVEINCVIYGMAMWHSKEESDMCYVLCER